ncbi:MAG: septal ring lytic transglycosylase RlpA family protein [Pseudomonadota bacterium]
MVVYSASGLTRFTIMGVAALALSACGSADSIDRAVPLADRGHINNKTKFSQAAYGVAASPRVTTSRHVRKGGGRRQIGKPYKIKGKWYYPKEEPGYDRKGQASWYGPNFHGRLTANGEVYDQFALTAAHPTFPLPSYARVTNLANGRSIVVRVNDRGPYHAKRIIDLSAKASELLGYQHKGVADVRVQYIKQAPLHGQDHRFLMASFRSGSSDNKPLYASDRRSPAPNDGNYDRMSVGSVKKASSEDKDPFLKELDAIKANKDTGSTLARRLKGQFILSGASSP